jgi:ADP-ribose pyrophosphatase YjhB (NUDIX family)
MGDRLVCPHCGRTLDWFEQPRLTVDAVVRNAEGEVLLIERKHEPRGWALPGGFVDRGETLEQAVARELEEETGLRATDVRQFHTYSDPARDPRHHTVSTVFLVRGEGALRAGDDAARARFFPLHALPTPLAFDHAAILADVARLDPSGPGRER